MSKTTTWICDHCGRTIEKASDGLLEWLIRDEKSKLVGRGLRLVHHDVEGKCQYRDQVECNRDGSNINDHPLEQYLGADGLMELLSFIADGRIPTAEVLEMIKRLHIPGYEHARGHFNRAIADRVFEPNTIEGYYTQSDIKAVLKFIGH